MFGPLLALVALLLPSPRTSIDFWVDDETYDGETTSVSLPAELHLRNRGGSDGAGLCVFASLSHAGRYQAVPVAEAIFEFMFRYPGGGYPEKVDTMMRRCARELDRPVPEYLQHTGGDANVLELALATGRYPCVTYAGRDSQFYRSRIAHMVNLIHLSSQLACIHDNNFPGKYLWMRRRDFLDRWRDMGGGWCIVLLDSPPPPVPPATQTTMPSPEGCPCRPDCSCDPCRCEPAPKDWLQVQCGPEGCPGGCPGGFCPAPGPLDLSANPRFVPQTPTWVPSSLPPLLVPQIVGCDECELRRGTGTDIHRIYLYQRGQRVLGYDCRDRYIRFYDPVTDRWGPVHRFDAVPANRVLFTKLARTADPQSEQKQRDLKFQPTFQAPIEAVEGANVPNYGLDLGRIRQSPGYSKDGQAITRQQAYAILEGRLVDDRTHPFVTVVGNNRQLERAREAFKQSKYLGKVHFNALPADHWRVRQAGFTSGLVIQDPQGKVLRTAETMTDLDAEIDSALAPSPPPKPLPKPQPNPEPAPTNRMWLPWVSMGLVALLLILVARDITYRHRLR